jgi:hypothetical protein
VKQLHDGLARIEITFKDNDRDSPVAAAMSSGKTERIQMRLEPGLDIPAETCD